MLRSLVLAGLARFPLLTVVCETLLLGVARMRAAEWTPATVAHGELAVMAELPVASVNGTPGEVGAAEGRLFDGHVRPLLSLMAVQPRLLLARRTAGFAATIAAIDPQTRERLTALATTSGTKAETLIEANALVDAQCSAAVALPHREQPLRVARNMDFFPAKILGPGSVVQVTRLAGCRPYATIGWPGSAAVVSGMNDTGLVACILLNHEGPTLAGGEPVGLRLAEILQHDTTVEEAVARFAARPVGSSHYVLFADAATATVVWHEPKGMKRDDPHAGWLLASNGPRVARQPNDERGRCLRDVCNGDADAARMRQLLTASYMPAINAQAMVFEPATLTLELALGTGSHPAARQRWWRIPLAELLAGASPATAGVTRLPPSEPLRHYTE